MVRQLKDSGVDWIGRIPVDWNISSMKNLISFINGFAFESKDLLKEGKFPVVKIGDFTSNNLDLINANYCNVESEEMKRFFIKNNDILIAMSGGTVGKIVYVKAIEVDAYINQRVGIIRSENSKFIHYVLSTGEFLKYITLLAGGTAQPNISTDNINRYKIAIPSKTEQQKIVSYLEQKVPQVDSIIKNTKQSIVEFQKYKQSLINETVTKGLNSNNKMKNSGVKWIGEIPSNWIISKIKYNCYLKGRIGWQGLTSDEYQEEGPFLVTGKDFNNGKINWDTCVHITRERFDEAKEIQLRENDLLITKDGTIGKVALIEKMNEDASLNSGVLLIRKVKNTYVEKYLFYTLKSDVFWKWYNAIKPPNSTILHLYQNDFKEFSYALPSLEEQQKIANYLDDKCLHIDNLIEKKQELITELEKYKKALIYEYVTGKKEVE